MSGPHDNNRCPSCGYTEGHESDCGLAQRRAQPETAEPIPLEMRRVGGIARLQADLRNRDANIRDLQAQLTANARVSSRAPPRPTAVVRFDFDARTVTWRYATEGDVRAIVAWAEGWTEAAPGSEGGDGKRKGGDE